MNQLGAQRAWQKMVQSGIPGNLSANVDDVRSELLIMSKVMQITRLPGGSTDDWRQAAGTLEALHAMISPKGGPEWAAIPHLMSSPTSKCSL